MIDVQRDWYFKTYHRGIVKIGLHRHGFGGARGAEGNRGRRGKPGMCQRLPDGVAESGRLIDRDAVKARYQVGPVDPLVLFVGDLDERHGPDDLVK